MAQGLRVAQNLGAYPSPLCQFTEARTIKAQSQDEALHRRDGQ